MNKRNKRSDSAKALGNLLLMIKYDFKQSFKYNRFKFILLTAAMLALGLAVSGSAFGDRLVFAAKGMERFSGEPGERFSIPFNWLSANLFVAFFIGNYATNEMYGFGQQLLMRSTKKSYWIVSKYLYGVYTVIAVYLVQYAAMFLLSVKNGESLVLMPSNDFCAERYGMSFEGFPSYLTTRSIIIQPIIASIAISTIQLTLSWAIRPLVSYLFVTIYIIASAYYQAYFLIGNHSMLMRNRLFSEDGLDGTLCISIDIIISLAFFLFGSLYFNKHDIIKRNQE